MLRKVFPVTYNYLILFADIINVHSIVYSKFGNGWMVGMNSFKTRIRIAKFDIF